MKTKLFTIALFAAILCACNNDAGVTTLKYVNNTSYTAKCYIDGDLTTTISGMSNKTETVSTNTPYSIVLKLYDGSSVKKSWSWNAYRFNSSYSYKMVINNSDASISKY